jgi:hypothetical protein
MADAGTMMPAVIDPYAYEGTPEAIAANVGPVQTPWIIYALIALAIYFLWGED